MDGCVTRRRRAISTWLGRSVSRRTIPVGRNATVDRSLNFLTARRTCCSLTIPSPLIRTRSSRCRDRAKMDPRPDHGETVTEVQAD